MKFDWRSFCTAHAIPFVEHGSFVRGVPVGNIATHCPWCPNGQDNYHLGLKTDPHQPYWGCWADPAHRGRSPIRLIMKLLDCTYEYAQELLKQDDTADIDEYEAVVQRILYPQQPKSEEDASVADRKLKMPREFRLLTEGRRGAPFLSYMEERGFADAAEMAIYYSLRFSLVGHFKRRIIIPIYANDKLMGWTARDITGKSIIRYRTLSHKPETAESQGYPPALAVVKDLLFNFDRANENGSVLAVCEGPMDALKMDWYAPEGCHAIAAFGMPEEPQLPLIAELSKRYKKVIIVLDRDAQSKSLELVAQLEGVSACPVRFQALPTGIKDPGDLRAGAIRRLFLEGTKKRLQTA